MQIYGDDKKQIGTLLRFKNRKITTTLSSGDKELSFEYAADGEATELLNEECYIRTTTDEFVLKETEKGKEYNKYTAVLNVEELEGMQFPYGFASIEQTVRSCLEFAFEGTGWKVKTCTITKKRTIDEEGNVSAWNVLQKCLSTYRAECVIDSINKEINIFERIGNDKGCYFMEGLNLRKLVLKSDTYEFFTRIYPIGKDGITPEWVIGKDYIDNFQYSNKIKAHVWKDERYTNTTSLIEDATAKLEELSRPYIAFEAEITDLAKANPMYKDILSYKIGDTVTLIAKRMRTKEKQRIVKIDEYPEMPERNTVELSNTKKTFAEIQKEAVDAAKGEAISITKKYAKKILENYSTTEEMETKIAASKDTIELGVMHTLENYYDKTETNAEIELSKGEISLEVSENYQTKTGMQDYSTTIEIGSLIDMAVDEMKLEVRNNGTSSSLTLKAGEAILSSEVIKITGVVKFEDLSKEGMTSINGKNITTGIIKDKGGNTEWNMETGVLKSKKLTVESERFKLSEDGNATMNDATMNDATISNAIINDATISNAIINDATISNATMIDATISNARMNDATISNATMIDATISNATMIDAIINDATLTNAIIRSAEIQNAKIINGSIRQEVAGAHLDIINASISGGYNNEANNEIDFSNRVGGNSAMAIIGERGVQLRTPNLYVVDSAEATEIYRGFTGRKKFITDIEDYGNGEIGWSWSRYTFVNGIMVE